MTFLIVENNENMRIYIKKILNRGLLAVDVIFECDDGEVALAKYQKYHPDWVLMDIQLKKIDGLTAMKLILDYDPNAKVLIITQYDEPEYRKMAVDMGVIAYVTKDSLSDLAPIIKSQL